MPAAKLNLSIDQGATFIHRLQLRAGPDIYAPVKNLTGYSARAQLRPDISSPVVLLELTTGNGRIVLTPADGALEIRLSPSETAELDFDKAVYDMEIESPSGDVTRILQGSFKLNKQVTR